MFEAENERLQRHQAVQEDEKDIDSLMEDMRSLENITAEIRQLGRGERMRKLLTYNSNSDESW